LFGNQINRQCDDIGDQHRQAEQQPEYINPAINDQDKDKGCKDRQPDYVAKQRKARCFLWLKPERPDQYAPEPVKIGNGKDAARQDTRRKSQGTEQEPRCGQNDEQCQAAGGEYGKDIFFSYLCRFRPSLFPGWP
jgi:hypothetical protein